MEFPRWRPVNVHDRDVGRRLDVYMADRFDGWSRTEIARAIKDGLIVSSQRERLKPSSRLRPGEHLKVFIPGLAPDEPPPPLPQVLFEDAKMLVLSKPPGMLAHPAGKTFVYALVGLAKAARPDEKPDLVHRLDRETSGAILLTKDPASNAVMKAHIKAGRMKKVYLAICHGDPEWDQIDVKAPIGNPPESEVRLRRGVVEGGLESHTTFTVERRLGTLTLLRCRLHTGRTHQIRVHLEHVGHPLLGDKLYGQPDHVFLEHLDHGATPLVRTAVGFPRHCLHAWRVVFPHPDGHRMGVEAPLPADMQAILDGATPAWPLDPCPDEDPASG